MMKPHVPVNVFKEATLISCDTLLNLAARDLFQLNTIVNKKNSWSRHLVHILILFPSKSNFDLWQFFWWWVKDFRCIKKIHNSLFLFRIIYSYRVNSHGPSEGIDNGPVCECTRGCSLIVELGREPWFSCSNCSRNKIVSDFLLYMFDP